MSAGELCGWISTGMFACSYLLRSARALLLLQLASACLGLVYGLAVGAMPLVVANAVIVASAGYKIARSLVGRRIGLE